MIHTKKDFGYFVLLPMIAGYILTETEFVVDKCELKSRIV